MYGAKEEKETKVHAHVKSSMDVDEAVKKIVKDYKRRGKNPPHPIIVSFEQHDGIKPNGHHFDPMV